MKNLTILFLLLGLLVVQLPAQSTKPPPLVVSAFNMGTQLPGSGVLGVYTVPLHPGLRLGSEFIYRSGPHTELFQTLNGAYFYHRYSQYAIQLYTEIGYRYFWNMGLEVGGKLGAGYLHSVPYSKLYKYTESGYEETGAWGRPQFMGTTSLQLAYRFSQGGWRPFLEYQFCLQMPFVKEYVPLVPITALHAGVVIPIRF